MNNVFDWIIFFEAVCWTFSFICCMGELVVYIQTTSKMIREGCTKEDFERLANDIEGLKNDIPIYRKLVK